MSGCLLVTYERNGARVAGHIGTVGVTDALPASINTNVKATFRNYITANPNMPISGFNPHSAPGLPHPAPAKSAEDDGFEQWGLMTTNGEFYAVHAWQQARPVGDPAALAALGTATAYRIADIFRVNPLTRAQILAVV